MSTLNILIVEDNPSFLLELEMLIDDIGYNVIDKVDNAKDALLVIEKSKPDLILMDIDIKGEVNGLQLADMLEAEKIPILFITAFRGDDYFDQAKSKQMHVGFLSKPVERFTLQSFIEVALRNVSKTTRTTSIPGEDFVLKDSFFIKSNNILQKVKIRDIEFVQSEGNYCILYTPTRKHVIKLSLTKVVAELPMDAFIRIHKSFAAQVALIDNINLGSNELSLGARTLPVGRRFKEDLISRIKTL